VRPAAEPNSESEEEMAEDEAEAEDEAAPVPDKEIHGAMPKIPTGEIVKADGRPVAVLVT